MTDPKTEALRDDITLLREAILANQSVLLALRNASTHAPTKNMLADVMDANTRVLNIAAAKVIAEK
jgi:hypothetical protein